MTLDEIKQKAIEEIERKTLGVTEQFLEIHEIVFEGDKPKIARIDSEHPDHHAIVYLPVKGEKFYFAIYLNDEEVTWADTEDYNYVCFRAFSEELSFAELSSLTNLPITGGWNIGDPRGNNGKASQKNSCIAIEPNPEPDEFDDKLNKLLDLLEQDREGINKLVEKAEGYIQTVVIFHNGDTMLGGVHLEKEQIRRLAALNLEIDFDLYAEGNFFKETEF